MDEKKKRIKNRSSLSPSVDKQVENTNLHCQQLMPIPIEYLPSITLVPHIKHHSSTVNQQTELFSNNQHLLFNQNIRPVSSPSSLISTASRKRPVEDNYLTHEHEQYTNKRTRREQSSNIELENQPPRPTIENLSLLLCYPRQNSNDLQMQSGTSTSSFNQTSPSFENHDQLNPLPNHNYAQNLTNHFPSSDLHRQHRTHHHLSIFHEDDGLISPIRKSSYSNASMNAIKDNICLLSSQSNLTNPLRATNFILDSKQQTTTRTGNISPAHSDSSSESVSTCSSDEQQLHYYSYHQPSRSYRERENYEQLLDLAEKLSDPNRFNKVDVEQFISYHYKAIATTAKTTVDILSSKQTACVICMSHFRSGQHIRVLPCQHEYHSKCIARWFTMNSSCPICRRDISLSIR